MDVDSVESTKSVDSVGRVPRVLKVPRVPKVSRVPKVPKVLKILMWWLSMKPIKNESQFVDRALAEVSKVIVGQRDMLEGILIGLLTGGACPA